IISHSSLFYWWPVWLVGFIMAGLTWWDGYRLAVVPPHTKPIKNAVVVPPRADGKQPKPITRDVLVLDEGKELLKKTDESGELLQPDDIRMASSKSYGILYVVVLLLVIFITNVPLRGLWSLFIIIFILMISIIFAQSGIWDEILTRSKLLAIHINLG